MKFLWSLKFGAWSFAVLVLSLLTVPASAQFQNTSLPAALTNHPAYQAQMWAWRQRAMPLGYVPVGARDRALNQISQIQGQATRNGPAGPALTGNSWISVGPAPIQNGQVSPRQPVSGRIVAIAVDPSDPTHWLVGAAQGGVWATHDSGGTWTPLTDAQASLASGAIAFAPSSPNTVYVGTGETSLAGDTYAGAGLLKSTDGGATWQLLAGATFGHTSFDHIKVSPTDPNTLVATTGWGVAGRGGELPPNLPPTGVFKSTDGGVTWTATLKGQGFGLDVNPSNFLQQYSALGFLIGDPANGVYRSTDGGTTWTLISGPWGNGNGLGRIELAISPSVPATMYVSIQDPFTFGSLGVWRTDNAWDATPTWTQLPAIPTFGNQFWYDLVVSVDPANANTLYLGETPLWKFNGTSWTAIGGNYNQNVEGINIHPDQHGLAWAGSTLIIGNDGGVWTTSDGGNTFANKNTTLATTQFYEGSIHPTNATFAIGGSQDDGTELWTGNDSWNLVFFGDGCDNAISSSRPDTDWAVSFQGLNIFRTRDAGVTFDVGDTGIDHRFAPFVGIFDESPSNPDIFIAGTDRLWRCNNFFSASAPTWTANSPSINDTVTAMAFATSDTSGNTYAFGSAGGQIWLTSDGGTTWANINSANSVPGRNVTDLAFSSASANVLYVTLSGFDEGTPGQSGHVFMTANALAASPTWVNVSTPVNIPNNSIVLDPLSPSTVYAGTDIAVWKSIDGGNSWSFSGPSAGLPNVAVFEMKINRVYNELFAFTHGRSAWVLPLTTAGGPGNGADVFVTMKANPNPLIIGGNLTYTITIGNNGPLQATNVVMNQTLPNNVTFISASTTRGVVSQNGALVTCNIAALDPGTTATVTVMVLPLVTGTLLSTASVTSGVPDPDTSNNSATTASVVIPPTSDLVAGLAEAPNPAQVGGTMTYTVSVLNRGPSTATGVTVSNILPASVVVLSASVSQGSLTTSSNLVLCSFGTLTNGGRASATIVVTPTAQGVLVAAATATADQFDPLLANNTARVTTTVSPSADLALTMAANPNPAIVGSNVTYSITVTNLGPSSAGGVIVNGNLPAAATVVSMNTSQGTLTTSGTSFTGTLGSLSVGSGALLRITVTYATNGTFLANASVSASQSDPNTANNSASVATVVAPPFVSVVPAGATLTSESFTPADGAIENGETVTVTLFLRNAGNVSSASVSATLLATNGVTPAGNNTQSYGVLTNSAAPVGRPFSLTASGANGGTISAVLQFQTTNGPVSFTFTLPTIFTFANTNFINIRDTNSAVPYPSTITVSGLSGTVGKVTATLLNLGHTYPQDIDALLAGPTGQNTILMSGAGAPPVQGANVTFDDGAAGPIPDGNGQIFTGSYQPASYLPSQDLAAPAPAHPYPAAMSVFNAANPNGVWSLYVDDHSPGDVGAVTNGWSLSVALITPVNQLADLAVTGTASPAPAVAGSPLTYLFTVTNSGPNTASFVVFTNALPPGMSLISASSSQGSAPTASGSVVTANLGPLNVGASASVTIVALPGAAAAGTATSIANVASASETDLNPANNTVSVISSVALPLADVGVSQTAAPNPALVGSNVTFTISVTNRGPGLALDLALTNPIPSGALFVSATSTVGTATSLGGVVTCQFGNLASSTSAVVTVVYHASSAGLITNSAMLFTDSVDTNLADNSSAYILTIASPAPNILPAGAHLSAESFSPPDGAIESGETVTVSLALTNAGSADTTANFTATLMGLTGIAPGNPTQQTYGVVHPGGAVVSRPFTFTASGGNGATIVASLHLLDGANDLGTASFPFTLAQHSSFSNLAAIIIPEHGPGNPYPASLAVSSMTGAVSKATVTLYGYGHTYPSDVSFLLVGPSGADAVLSSKTGGPHSITNVNLTFDDSAANGLPLFAQILPGTYHPTSSNSSLAMPSPAPSRPYGSALANLNGSNPNGAWSLYVFDDTPGDGGVIAGGWSLDLTTVSPVNPLVDVGLTMSGSPAVLFVGANITNTISLTNFGPSSATGVIVTNGLSAGVNFVSASLSQGAIASSVGGRVVWNVGALAANGGASGIIITAPALAGSAVSTVTVGANESDLNPANNSAQTTATVISPAPIHLSGLVTNRQFQLTLTAEPNLPYSIQASTNLTTWLSLVTTNANAGGTIKYTDTTAPGYQYRYYRAVRLLP